MIHVQDPEGVIGLIQDVDLNHLAAAAAAAAATTQVQYPAKNFVLSNSRMKLLSVCRQKIIDTEWQG